MQIILQILIKFPNYNLFYTIFFKSLFIIFYIKHIIPDYWLTLLLSSNIFNRVLNATFILLSPFLHIRYIILLIAYFLIDDSILDLKQFSMRKQLIWYNYLDFKPCSINSALISRSFGFFMWSIVLLTASSNLISDFRWDCCIYNLNCSCEHLN